MKCKIQAALFLMLTIRIIPYETLVNANQFAMTTLLERFLNLSVKHEKFKIE